MNKAELVEAMAKVSGLPKAHAEKALNAFTDVVMDALVDGDKVQLVGFGTFETTVREAREGRNPKTGETLQIPKHTVPKFKPGKALKDALN